MATLADPVFANHSLEEQNGPSMVSKS